MRKNKFYFLIFVSLIIWAIATYFLFQHKPANYHASEVSDIEEQLHKLENDVQKQYKENLNMMSFLKKIIDNKKNELNNVNAPDTVVKPEANVIPEEGIKRVEDAVRPPSYSHSDFKGPVIAVLVFACNRITVSQSLNGLLKYRPSKQQFPIIVTQDCDHKETAQVIASYGDNVTHIRQPDKSDIQVPPKEKKFKGYFKIARHYGWALNETFFNMNFNATIIIEDDLEVSPDIYDYFLGLYPILKQDPSLFCVSAWNDNGKAKQIDVSAAELLYRTDFFPGLGWMLLKKHWMEFAPKWPSSYWDDWIRRPEQRKGRSCIRPEISRTRTFGRQGVSNGLFFDKHLKYIVLNKISVPFTQMDMSYLLKDNYDMKFVQDVYNSTVVTLNDLKGGLIPHKQPVRIQYNTKDNYKLAAKAFGLMEDFKSGVPRTGYRGIVSFFFNGRRVYLAPKDGWKQYDPSWS